jgi:glyoxylase-like metal-dependent hydrolase (beta-lactamase superfamily II)
MHLHTDHVGWNTRLEKGQWVPTFPKARCVFADRELAYRAGQRVRGLPIPCSRSWPANRVDIVKSAHAFSDFVTLIRTPGHTIDHYSVRVGELLEPMPSLPAT